MDLHQLGLNASIQEHLDQHPDFQAGRVVKQHRDRYEVMTANGKVTAEITGHLRFTAESGDDFPAVGDWVSYDGVG